MATETVQRLVGRDAETARIERSLDGLGRRSAAVLVLVGEPGIGKSRLLAEIELRATGREHLVLAGRATEFERELPFAVVVDALDRRLSELDPRRLQALGPARLAELARIFPALGDLAGAEVRGLEGERYEAHRAVGALLERLAAPRPAVLILDDLHWADDASLELVSYLLRRPPRAPLLVALAHRPGQASPGLIAALDRAVGEGLCERIALEPLGPRDARELLGSGVDDRRAEQLQRETGGNPFYLRQLARSAAPPRPAVPIMAADGELPAPVLAAIGHEVGQLPAPARALLEAAAVAGDPFELDVAGPVAELAEVEALGALDALVAHELVRATDLPRRFTFRHPIVRRAVYESLPPGRRIAAHRRAADALQEIGAPAAVQAHHLAPSAARGDERALAVFTEAATGAGTRAPAAAAHWLDAALRLLGPEDARRLALLGPLATALAATGRLAEARARLLEVLALLPPGTSVLRATLVAVLAAVEHLLGLHEDATARLRTGLAQISDTSSLEACALQVEVAWDGLYAIDWGQMRAFGGRALETARSHGDGALIAAAGAVTAFGELCEREVVAARRHCDEAAAALDATEDGELAARPGSAYMLGWTEHFLERYEDAIRHLDRGIAISRATGQGQFFLPMTLGKVMALCAIGRLDEANELAESAVEGARLAANDQLLAWALWERCWAAALAGDLDTALPAGTESVRLAGALEFNVLTRAGHLAYAYALLEAGEADGALEQLRLGGADRPGFEPASQCLWYEQLAAAELGRDQRSEAEAWARRAGDCAAGLDLAFADAMGQRAAARVLLAAGDAAAAAEAAREAAAAADRGAAPVQAALARELAGLALAAAGDPAAGAEELGRALEQLEACGAGRRRDRVARELRRLGLRVPRRGRRGGAGAGAGPLAALSDREREVAELVAAGRTNREIAEELFLSKRTVDTHLAHVFEKLGVSSRAAVAAVVARQLD
jgi:DNA-binding CsgD family transcriptional regulator/tetratricopeptide (TPR) repeat protein